LPPPSTATAARLKSIDVFRGLVITAMILVNGEFSHEESYRQLAHAAWNGWTFADTIFPAFLFMVGVSLTLSTAARIARGEQRAHLLAHAVRRSLLIFACGVAIDYVRVPAHDFPFVGVQDHLQLTGVLQKIAVCYLFAFAIYLWTGFRGVAVGVVLLNVVYLAFLYLYPVPGCGAGSLTVNCNFPDYVDGLLLHGFRWNSTAFDPDGIGAILPATSSALFGILAGQLLRTESRPERRMRRLAGGGLILVVAGELLATWVPINKQLWTPSFALLMAGLAAVGLACCIALVDRGPPRSWYRPLEMLGRNAVAAYLISRVLANVPRVHVAGRSLYDNVLAHIANPANASLLFALLVVAAVFLAVFFMDRKGWRLKF
jgi:predicted acyltransferase